MCQEFFLSGFSMFPYAYHLFFPTKSSTIISKLVLARNDFDFHCFQFWVNWCDSWEWSHSPGPSCAAPGDSESHYRIDQLVLHVQGPWWNELWWKGSEWTFWSFTLGSWDEGGMKEAGCFFFFWDVRCITRILAEGFMKGRFRHCKSWRKIPTEDQFPLRWMNQRRFEGSWFEEKNQIFTLTLQRWPVQGSVPNVGVKTEISTSLSLSSGV